MPLTAGQLLGPPFRLLAQLNRFEDGINAFAPLDRLHPSDPEPELEVLPNAEMREQGITLEDHADPASFRRDGIQAATFQFDASLVRLLQASDQAEGCALATAAGAEQSDTFTVLNLKVEVTEDPARSEAFAQGVQFQHQPFTAPLVSPATICL